ncbi:MAG TPA: alpha/beta hydrolase [Puia sp.]|nr:alpha/beta hydrolase [Puia sp.]
MVKVVSVLAFYFLIVSACAGQVKPALYRDSVFSTVRVEPDLAYRSPLPAGKAGKAYHFDLYEPGEGTASEPAGLAAASLSTPAAGAGASGRPLIIWMHGGGFRFGSRKAAGARFWCTSFARRGYLCASIEYRMTVKKTLTSFPALIKGCSIAVEDAREAVAYFKANYKKWNIDTNCIILGGNSAGGMIALQAAYSRPADLARLAGDTVAGGSTPISGYSDGVAAVINFWGAIFDANWLNNARVPIVSVHGGNDHIVSAGRKGEHFFGSLSIHEKADSLSIPNRVKIYNGYSHELQKHFNPFFTGRAPKRRWQEAGQFAADFLYKEVIAKEIVASIPIRR